MNKALVAAVAVGGLLFAVAGPAAATTANAGSGGGTGWEVPEDFPGHSGPDDCAGFEGLIGFIKSSTFDLYHVGTLKGVDPIGNKAAYVGDTHVHIKVGEHVISPAGTSPTCPLAPTPHPFPTLLASASVEDVPGGTLSGGPGGDVTCDTLQPGSTYLRVNNVASFTFTLLCDITGNTSILNQTVTNVPTTFTIQGTMNPCILVPPLGMPTNPECDQAQAASGTGNNGIAPPEPNAGSHLVTTYAAAGMLP